MQVVFFKSETTGFFDFKEDASHESQPHMVSLSAIKMDIETGKEIERLNIPVIRADGWDISVKATEIHGVSIESATETGTSEKKATHKLISFVGDCPLYSYGSNYNRKVIAAATHRYCSEETQAHWNDKSRHNCVQSDARKTIKGRIPSLVNAFNVFTGQSLSAPHTARQNVDACMTIYFAIKPVLAETP